MALKYASDTPFFGEETLKLLRGLQYFNDYIGRPVIRTFSGISGDQVNDWHSKLKKFPLINGLDSIVSSVYSFNTRIAGYFTEKMVKASLNCLLPISDEIDFVGYYIGPGLLSNVYVIEGTNGVTVVDPGIPGIGLALKALKYNVENIILTHEHADHYRGLDSLKTEFPNAIVIASESTMNTLDKTAGSIESYIYVMGGKLPNIKVDLFLKDGKLFNSDGTEAFDSNVIAIGNGLSLKLLSTPGHTPGSICVKSEGRGGDLIWTGDTLFNGVDSPTNLDGGNKRVLLDETYNGAFRDEISSYTKLLPGHCKPGSSALEALDDARISLEESMKNVPYGGRPIDLY